jgi:hypothetical protein
MIIGAGETSEKTAKLFDLAERPKSVYPIALLSEPKLWQHSLADAPFILMIGSQSSAILIYWSVPPRLRTRLSPQINWRHSGELAGTGRSL